MEPQPRYKHDCGPEHGCVFVGYLDDDDIWFHEYFLDQDVCHTCVILRHSSDPEDYGSWGSNDQSSFVPERYEQAIAMIVKYKHDREK